MIQNDKNTTKYIYDYPENRALGEYLTDEDRKWIATTLKKHSSYIYLIFVKGTRTNKKAIELAKIIRDQKLERDNLAKAI